MLPIQHLPANLMQFYILVKTRRNTSLDLRFYFQQIPTMVLRVYSSYHGCCKEQYKTQPSSMHTRGYSSAISWPHSVFWFIAMLLFNWTKLLDSFVLMILIVGVGLKMAKIYHQSDKILFFYVIFIGYNIICFR